METWRLIQITLARGLDDAAPTARDGGLDQFVEMGVETRARPRLVFAHEPGISGHVGG